VEQLGTLNASGNAGASTGAMMDNSFLAGANQNYGVVGNIYGLTVISNAWVPSDRIGVFDLSTKPMAYVERRPLTVEEANPGFGINRFIHVYEIWIKNR